MKKRSLKEILKEIESLGDIIVREGNTTLAIVRHANSTLLKIEVIREPPKTWWLFDVQNIEEYLALQKEHVQCVEKGLEHFKKIEPRLKELQEEYNNCMADLYPLEEDRRVEDEEGF